MALFGGSSISEGSKSTYLSKLKKLNGNMVPTDVNFLKNSKRILEQIELIPNPNTRRSSIIAVVSVLKDNKKFKKEYQVYHTEMMKINAVLNKTSYKSDATKDKQTKVNMADLLSRQKDLAAIMPIIQKKKKIGDDQMQQLHDLVIVSLYTLLPPRRNIDYSEMVVAAPTDDKTKNYYHAGNFYFNNYKTKTTYKQQVVNIPEELNAILKIWIKLKQKGNEYLLVNLQTNAKYKPTDMTKLLKQVFQNEHIGVSVLRNVFLSEKYSDVMSKLKKDAEQMGTSIGVAENTYIKK
jgi:hypothetical protein